MRAPERLRWRPVALGLVAVDVLTISGGLLVAHTLRFAGAFDAVLSHQSPTFPFAALGLVALAWLAAFAAIGLYRRSNLVSGIGEYRRVVQAGAVVLVAVITFTYLLTQPYISRGFLFIAVISVTVAASAGRFGYRRLLYSAAQRGRVLDFVLVVGDGRAAVAAARQLDQSLAASSRVVGFLSENLPTGSTVGGTFKVLGEPLQLEQVAAATGTSRALVVESGLSWESLQGLVQLMHRRTGIEILLLPGLFDIHATAMTPVQVGPMLALAPQPSRIVGADAVLKRSFDLVAGTLAMLIALPLMAFIAAAASVGGRGTGLRRVEYAGPHGPVRSFRFAQPGWVAGAHVSRLPELMLVLSGRMSLIGPRPVPRDAAGRYATAWAFLSQAKPGFIGPWWLVDRGRPTELDEELAYDLHYLRNYSIWLDLQVMVHVVRAFVARSSELRLALPGGVGNAAIGESRLPR